MGDKLSAYVRLLTIICLLTVADSATKNELANSLLKQLLHEESESTSYKLYPTSAGAGQEFKNSLLKLQSTSYILPEPGCTCVPRLKDCDFECCYCELSCPLPNSVSFIKDWLSNFYGNGCKNGKKRDREAGVSIQERREESWRKSWPFCDRPDYSLNAQMTSFPFICVHADNSYTSLHYNLRPPRPDLIRMTNLTPVKYTWPTVQRFYNNCLPKGNLEKAEDIQEPSIDKSQLLLQRVRQLFYLEPPSSELMNSQKGQLSHDKLCLSERKKAEEIAVIKKKKVHKLLRDRDAASILDQAIENLGQRKLNFLANLKVKLMKTPGSCQQYRNELADVSEFWIKKFKAFTEGNQNISKTNKSIMPEETENLSDRQWQVDKSAEIFPEKCRNVIAGMKFNVLFSRDFVFEITHKTFTHDLAVKTSPSFFIQIQSISSTKLISKKMSRFWTDYMLYECPHQFCWRDLFDFNYLLADSVVILAVFIFVPVLALLMYSQVGFCGIL